MREIMFRGKRTHNGEWVEGCLYRNLYGDYQIREHKIYDDDVYIDDYNIIPETVGQYTGLTDKNGKKIFEGDVVDTPDRLIEVVWLRGNAQFDLKFIRYAHDTRMTNFKGIAMRDLIEYEVIGNIHDNPELLKGGAE